LEGDRKVFTKQTKSLATAVLITALTAACGDGGPEATGDVEVTLQQSAAIVAQVVSDWSASIVSGDASMTLIEPDTVESLTVRVTTIQFLPQGRDETDDGSWVTLALGTPVLLDLMELPAEGESPLVIVSGTVEVGTYGHVRLYTDSAAIQFKGPISLGAASDFDGGVDYQVEIPSVEQTGINTDVSFTVEADADGIVNEVNLLFDTGSTFQNVAATGTGMVMLTPVINERGDGMF